MTLRLVHLGALLLIGLAVPALAGPAPKAVVELFTSQGCSSCPPADELLVELAGDIVALTLPVDYWDYLGWKDTLAQPSLTARQRAYASARNDKQVYATPQVVVNGLEADRRFRPRQDRRADRQGGGGSQAARGDRPEETGAALSVAIAARPMLPFRRSLASSVAKSREVLIARGENKGRTIAYANVVRGMVKLGDWSGAPVRFEVPLDQARPAGADSYVVLVQAAADAKPGNPRRRQGPRPVERAHSFASNRLYQDHLVGQLVVVVAAGRSMLGEDGADPADHRDEPVSRAARADRRDELGDRLSPDRLGDMGGDTGIGDDLRVVLRGCDVDQDAGPAAGADQPPRAKLAGGDLQRAPAG